MDIIGTCAVGVAEMLGRLVKGQAEVSKFNPALRFHLASGHYIVPRPVGS